MVKTWPKADDPRDALVEIGKAAMQSETIDLREVLACLRREMALRERVYPKWVAKGSMTQAKADRELELMRQAVDFVVHCVFKAVVKRQSLSLSLSPAADGPRNGEGPPR
jgi:hypothetical protein